MRQTAIALKSYLSSFNIPAYQQDSIPDDVPLPYITYPLKEPEWNQKTSFYFIVWYRSTGYGELLTKVDEILADIGEGKKINLENGYLVLYPEPTLVQEYNDEDNKAKGMYVSMAMNSYHMPGE